MLNPITYTEKVVEDFLRYQLTTYPFADARLHAQMRSLLNLEETRNTPLLQGPYVSLSQAFAQGESIAELVKRGILHPHLQALTSYTHVYGHQQQAFEAIHQGRTTLVATGTGSGKTESFLYPIISHCLRLRDEGAPEGIAAVLVYPMNALAEDQLGRLRELLAGSGVSFGMYVGKTPEETSQVGGKRLASGASRQDYLAAVEKTRKEKRAQAVHPPEERVSREEMRQPGKHPRILLTNVKQLELLLTRQRDVELFDDSSLRFLVFDEAHTFTGAQGGETACLIRRLRAFCGKTPEEVVCIATSATIADPRRGVEAGRDFAERFFGVDRANVALVGEAYERDAWAEKRKVPSALAGEPSVQLQTVLDVVRELEDDEPPAEAVRGLQRMFQNLTGQKLDPKRWQESLYERLSENEVAFRVAEALKKPRALSELVAELSEKVGRAVPAEEVLIWLALGAVSRHEGRPLLRPVVHAFVRGMAGAVVTFPDEQAEPKIWLSRQDAASGDEGAQSDKKLDVMTCTTCGQHYFVHAVEDFQFTERLPSGGRAEGDSAYWPTLDVTTGGKRVVLTDVVVGGEDEVEDEAVAAPNGTAYVYFCRMCGALHRSDGTLCSGCGRTGALVRLLAVRQKKDKAEQEGKLTRCVSCNANGRRVGSGYREPARPVRAITVSDVHVLAQNMLQHQGTSGARRRLIIFADNRQDAAFQAGWMQDHARRYRLRALMYERIAQGPLSVGDLVGSLDRLLDGDDDLSRALIPEVWRQARKEKAGHLHADERRYFLRIQVLRELTTGLRQRIGLEPWGRLKVRYLGLEAKSAFFQKWAHVVGCTPDELTEAAASLLDLARRSAALYDRDHEIFTKWWRDGSREVQQGYLAPTQGGPKALVFERETSESERLAQWLSTRGQTRAMQLAKKWGVPDRDLREFLEELWAHVTHEAMLIVPVTVRNQWDKVVPQTVGSMQVDADRLLLEPHEGFFRCLTCRRTQLRAGPHAACIQWRCTGTVVKVQENPDDYDLKVLDEGFALVRAREHSAQVPADERERLEREFKGGGEQVNTVVATPTLELGVDIGALDSVLMRNVPPLAANYWQRAGRAGRRHRMAVNVTYAGARSHDRVYFDEPLKLLDGRIDPPRFNLANEPMVRKHVHAAVISELHQLARPIRGLDEAERTRIEAALAAVFPTQIKGYLFDNAGNVRRGIFDLGPLRRVLSDHRAALLESVRSVFAGAWPEADRAVVGDEALARYVDEMSAGLHEVIQTLRRRLDWALDQLDRLDRLRQKKGTLDQAEESVRTRCDRLVKKLKGIETRRRQEAEGYDDTITYSVLAAEGFLPGYGLDSGSVVAFHQAPRNSPDVRDFQFRRGNALALREYAPGNFLYANGHRFYPRFFHLSAMSQGGSVEPVLYQVDLGSDSVVEQGALTSQAQSVSADLLPAVPICDVDLPHQSNIADDEDYRFQLPVAVFGTEQKRRGPGFRYRWGERNVEWRRRVHLRLVNVGATRLVRDQQRFGYPLCLVCGQSRSPFASEKELTDFREKHGDRCGAGSVRNVGFYADEVADALRIPECTDKEEAYSVAEALRMGAAEVLEMEREDLQILLVPITGSDKTHAILYDPMSGGSGLLEQMVQRWTEVVAAARRITEECPSACEKSCVDCLQHYRNSWYHGNLDRHVVADRLHAWGDALVVEYELREELPQADLGPLPVNDVEAALEQMIVTAGLPEPRRQHEIDLGLPLGRTTPDFFYDDPSERSEGICIYLDGLSASLHGSAEAQLRDGRLRDELRSRDYEVVVIAASHLHDRDQMVLHFATIARLLLGKAKSQALRSDTSWYVDPRKPSQPPPASSQPPPAATSSGWSDALELAEPTWVPLLKSLRDAGLPAPDDVAVELRVGGVVSQTKAIARWKSKKVVHLVAPDSGFVGDGYLVVSKNPVVSEIAERLRAALGGEA
jgi:ATP-dependent helicase YprA (DUF1998 family)